MGLAQDSPGKLGLPTYGGTIINVNQQHLQGWFGCNELCLLNYDTNCFQGTQAELFSVKAH